MGWGFRDILVSLSIYLAKEISWDPQVDKASSLRCSVCKDKDRLCCRARTVTTYVSIELSSQRKVVASSQVARPIIPSDHLVNFHKSKASELTRQRSLAQAVQAILRRTFPSTFWSCSCVKTMNPDGLDIADRVI